jgi:hypothetical protein
MCKKYGIRHCHMPYLLSFSSPEHEVNPYFPSFEAKKRLLLLKNQYYLKNAENGQLIEFPKF